MGDIKLKRPPPKDAMCDAMIGTDYSGPSPTLIRCRNKATVAIKSFPAEAWLCKDCYGKRQARKEQE